MRKTPLLALHLLALLPSIAAAQHRPDLPRVETLVIEGTNGFRREQRLSSLEESESLERAARKFAEHMARTGAFSHEADGSTPSARARASGYDFCLVSENISYQYGTAGFPTADLARRLVEGWKNSPGHRKNMLERDAVHTAVGVAQGAPAKGMQHYYAVQMFGRPKSASVEFEVSNTTREPVTYRVAERLFWLQPRTIRTHTDCAPEPLRFDLPGGSKGATEFTTRKGDKFAVVQERGQVSVVRN
jgi:uncharacterized protein YkwD